MDILSKMHKLYTDRKNVTDFLYLVLHLAHKVFAQGGLFMEENAYVPEGRNEEGRVANPISL